MKQQSRTVTRRRQSASPAPRHLPLVEILVDTQAGAPGAGRGLGPEGARGHAGRGSGARCVAPGMRIKPERQAYRAGHTPSQVVLGGRKVAMRRPRARRDGAEVPLPTVRAFTDTDPLNRRVVAQMLIGVATRQYARSLETAGPRPSPRGVRARVRSVDALWPRPRPSWTRGGRRRSTGSTWPCY